MNKESVSLPLKKLTFGGLQEYNLESIDLRKQQILDDFRLHSCYHYSESLEVIKKASEETQLIPKMITKVYFNFRRNNSLITILDQLYRITDRLRFIPKEWHIQICVNPPFRDFSNEDYLRFKEVVQNNFGKVKYFIETEKLWEKNTSKIINSNYVDGSCFFMNSFFRSINNDCFTNKPFITFGMLAGGHNHLNKYKKHYENNLKRNSKLENSEIIKKNIIFFLNLNKNVNFEYAITSISSKNNYIDLLNKVSILDNLNNDLNGKIELDYLIDVYSFLNCDAYGIKYAKKRYHKYIYNKSRVLHEILTLIPFIDYSKKWI
jgi:hypothetical protein